LEPLIPLMTRPAAAVLPRLMAELPLPNALMVPVLVTVPPAPRKMPLASAAPICVIVQELLTVPAAPVI
jgi:hypothetical protein